MKNIIGLSLLTLLLCACGESKIENKSTEQTVQSNTVATDTAAYAATRVAQNEKLTELVNIDSSSSTGKSKELYSKSEMQKRKSEQALQESEKENEIVNKYWKLKTLEGKSVTMTENQEREQYFMLKYDGSITGFAGCNHFNGQYELQKGNRIRVKENLAVTMKFCDDLKLNEAEFLEVFSLTDNYTINGDTLSLNVGRRAPLAVFEAVYF